jgi:tRNA A-37 threonylcarbamoyl transferase component Bud32
MEGESAKIGCFMGAAADRDDWIRERAELLTHEPLPVHPVVWDDTTSFMSIERGHVVALGGDLFLVRSNEHEGRFGIDDQPKFWVKRAISLGSGHVYILKLTCQEEFKIHIGTREIRCFRSAEKEAQVLELVRGDGRFMQGRAVRDTHGNLVRIVEFVAGPDFLSYLQSVPLHHEEYFRTLLPNILANVANSLAALQRLHDVGLCHGDIRNDHVLIERGTGSYKWIDFDLAQDSPDFDIWSAGNILHCTLAKGFVTFQDAIHIKPELSGRLSDADASVFFPNRVMNLRKVYGYIPDRLNDVLCRFSSGARVFYDKISQISDDLADCVASLV